MTTQEKQFEFNIIAGSLKGRKIITPNLGITRPPLSRLRKSIFDYLMPYITDSRYLDLYSGTGSYLFEAVSRGAAEATGVELDPRLSDAINRQAEKFGVADQLHCLTEDVFDAVPRLHKEGRVFDIIMIAPPQYVGLVDRTLELFRHYPLFTEDTKIICQHDTSELKVLLFDVLPIDQQRKYGHTTFTILRPPVK
ncbi:MAG: RsmD family RNA methyltransferase [bacterium]|nr:RsmD family RNA methyltransferase [bacterium]